jgi:hypothetical protein
MTTRRIVVAGSLILLLVAGSTWIWRDRLFPNSGSPAADAMPGTAPGPAAIMAARAIGNPARAEERPQIAHVAIVDLDRDGLNDVLVCDALRNIVTWIRQAPRGTFTEQEKVEIAKQHLVKKQIAANGLKDTDLDFTDEGLTALIQYYTREAGVRNLEREIGNVCRKVARKVVSKAKGQKREKITISGKNLSDFQGIQKYRDLVAEKKSESGAAVGLAWT